MAQVTMYPGINNSPQTTLTQSITASDTTIPVLSTDGLPPAPNIITIGTEDDAELVRYTGISGNQLTNCERGFNSTIANIWAQDELVYRGFTAYDHAAFKSNIEDLSSNKLNKTGDGEDVTVTFTEAAQKANISTGETLAVVFGKLAKWFSLFGGAAWLSVGTAANTVAAGIHASQHANGGTDEITPASIEAATSDHTHGNISNDGKIGSAAGNVLFTGTDGAAEARTPANALIALDVPANLFEYKGRELPFTWAQLKTKIQAGDFSGIRIGDYKTIVLTAGNYFDAASNSTKSLAAETVIMEVAGIDTYYQYGDTPVGHHIDFIARDCLSPTIQYNATNTNSGAYIGSQLYTTLNGASGIVNRLPADASAVIISKRGLTEVKTTASASSWAWNDLGKLWLPTEQEVWGVVTWGEHGYGGGLAIQYPIFRDGCRHIIKGAGNGGGRCYWWELSSMAGSAAYFALVDANGDPYYTGASNASLRVPLCFRVS